MMRRNKIVILNTASVEIAMLSDCIKNFSFIPQVTGSENRKLYEDAYDIGDDTLDVLAYVFSIDNPEKFKLKYHNDRLTKFMINARDIFQFTQADDFKHLVGFTDVMSSTMSASTRGLDALLENGNVNSLMYKSGKAVVNVYTGEEPLQTLYFERLIHENIIEKTEEFIKDTSKKLLPSAGAYL